MGRLAEGAPEAAAEVARRDVRGAGQRLEVERLGVAAVDEVAGAQEVAGERRVSRPGGQAEALERRGAVEVARLVGEARVVLGIAAVAWSAR